MSRLPRIRGLSQLEAAQLGASVPSQADAAVRKVVRGRGLTGEINAPAFEVSDVFDYQSYFDDSLQERALFRQAPNEPIVKSTVSDEIQVPGYGVGLHPSSETPVAIQFTGGAQQGASATYRLKPGEVIYPQGRDINGGAQFSGFFWGLPFGWLGGGSATLVVLRSANAHVDWGSDHNEVVYHRIRQKIYAPADLSVSGGLYTGPLNWPQRFPWAQAQYGSSSLTQRGQPALKVFPTRTAMSLRLSALTVGASPAGLMYAYWVGANVWASGSQPTDDTPAAISLADVRATPIQWSSWAQVAGAPAPFNAAYQTQVLTGEAELYAADAGAIVLTSADAALQNQYVDIVRYGRL